VGEILRISPTPSNRSRFRSWARRLRPLTIRCSRSSGRVAVDARSP